MRESSTRRVRLSFVAATLGPVVGIGLIIALWVAVALGLHLGAVQGNPGVRIGENFVLHVAALAAGLAGLVLVKALTPQRSRGLTASGNARVVNISAFAAAGLAAGATWHLLARWSGFATLADSTAQQAAQFAMVSISAMAVGLLIQHYSSVMARVRFQHEILRKQVRELERSRAALTESEERIRREIADLLHGPVQSRLLIIWHRMADCQELIESEPKRAAAMLADARDDLDRLREKEVRQASHLLHPEAIGAGLVKAVRALLARVQERAKIRVMIDPKLAKLDAPAANRLPAKIRLIAFRVIEESLNNIWRHADADTIDITLAVTPEDQLYVIVKDNGRGFDTSTMRPGLGLTTIAARVAQVGGVWHIASDPGSGTELGVSLPLSAVDERVEESAAEAPDSPPSSGSAGSDANAQKSGSAA